MKKIKETKWKKAHTICVMQIVGDTLKEQYKTQRWLSDQTGIHPTILSRMKKGLLNISAYQLDQMANALEIPLDWLRPKQKDIKSVVKYLKEMEG